MVLEPEPPPVAQVLALPPPTAGDLPLDRKKTMYVHKSHYLFTI